jgi:SAM-dependent methyltransferase
VAIEPFFNEAYKGVPPWDVGHPQSAFRRLDEQGAIGRRVLDAGCGTGENALLLAARGHQVTGIDGAPLAIRKAKRKARARSLSAAFVVHDALDLGSLGASFDSVVDSGLFHTFSDDERPKWERSLAAVLRPGGTYYLLCFSEHEPPGQGPRRIRRDEVTRLFTRERGWRVVSISDTRFDSRHGPAGARAYLAVIERLGEVGAA